MGPILNAGKLKALLLADGNSTRKCKALDISHSNIRKVRYDPGTVFCVVLFCGAADHCTHCIMYPRQTSWIAALDAIELLACGVTLSGRTLAW